MRRIWATVLLILIGLSLTGPLLVASPESGIAPCCRRDGKHHCAKMKTPAGDADADGRVRITATATCPLFSGGKSAPADVQTAAAPPARVLFFVPAFRIAKAAQAPVQARISESRSSQRRGPPTLLA